MSTIYGNMVGGASLAQTYILQDSEGNEMTATLVDSETVFDATPNDIRAGKVAATETGVTVGTKDIPSYNTTEGIKLIPVGSNCTLPIPNYAYTKIQAIFCLFNTKLEDSVSAEKVVIENAVYPVLSTVAETSIQADETNERIDFCFANTFTVPLLIRYFTYKEIY